MSFVVMILQGLGRDQSQQERRLAIARSDADWPTHPFCTAFIISRPTLAGPNIYLVVCDFHHVVGLESIKPRKYY